MKIAKQMLTVFSIMTILVLMGCVSKPKVRVVELENKGTVLKADTPPWVTTYIKDGLTGVQARSEYRDRYCIIGESSTVNREFALAWADDFNARQQIAAMLRTNVASQYKGEETGESQSAGLAGDTTAELQREINNILNAVVNVSYSGAQRDADWWSLIRRYDPDEKDVYSDGYTAYVLYTIPKVMLNQQVASALETSVSADSVLYDITIQLAKNILLGNIGYLGAGDLTLASTPPQTSDQRRAISTAGPFGTITIRNNSSNLGNIMTAVRIYNGHYAQGAPYEVYNNPVLSNEQVAWDLPEGVYTVEVFLNNASIGRNVTVHVTARGTFAADFFDGNIGAFFRR